MQGMKEGGTSVGTETEKESKVDADKNTQRARWPLRKGNQSLHPPRDTLSPALSLALPTPVPTWPEGYSPTGEPTSGAKTASCPLLSWG